VALPAGVGLTGQMTFANEYVFRGVELAKDSYQPAVELTRGGMNAGIWASLPMGKRQTSEMDLYAGYRRSLGSMEVEGVGTAYWYPEAKASRGEIRRSYEVGVGVSGELGRFTPSAYVYHDFTQSSETIEGALGFAVPFDGFGTATLDFNLYSGAVSARDRATHSFVSETTDAYGYYGFDVSITRRLNAMTALELAAHYADTLNLAGAGGLSGSRRSSNLWCTIGLTVGL